MDLPGIAALLLATGTLLWTAYEKVKAGRSSDGQFAKSIAEASDKMVDLMEQVYNRQIEDLKRRLATAEKELAGVKSKLEIYMQCPAKECPVRERTNGFTNKS